MPTRILRTALRDLALLVAVLAVGEAGIRVFVPQTARHMFTSTITGGHPIRYNGYELRDVEFPTARPPHERRILCVGDSATFGAGLPAEDTYPKQLERLLGTRAGHTSWFVINAGGQGSSVSMLSEFLQRTGVSFEPDAVILGFSPTMLSVAGRRRDNRHEGGGPAETPGWRVAATRAFRRAALKAHLSLQGSYLYIAFDTYVRRQLYRLGVLRDRMDKREGALFAYAFDVPGVDLDEVERAYAVLQDELRDLKELLGRPHIPLIVLGIPSRFRISDHWSDNERGYDLSRIRLEPLDRVGAIAQRLGIPFVDLGRVLRDTRRAMLARALPWDDLYIPGDHAHLNRAGMRLAAAELHRVLEALAITSALHTR